MPPRYRIRLSAAERRELTSLTRRGTHPARTITRARALLLAERGLRDGEIATALGVHARTITRLRRRAIEAGVLAALHDRPRPGGQPKLDGQQEALLVALACSEPPTGRSQWSMQLLAERLVELEVVEAISDETVRRTLEKNELKPWRKQQWCIPTVSALFVARMEDVLELYAAPFDPARPVVCLDEYPLALTAPVREGLPAAPGKVRKADYEYRRCGSCTLFAAFQPLAGWRTVAVSERRTAQDFAHFIKGLVDEHFPQAERIRVVLDNLNTHTLAALYQTFPAAEARRLAAKLEWHFTPVHGSWLNMIEIEWSVLAQQCLDQHLDSTATAERVIGAWVAARNARQATVHWRFTVPDARRAMAPLYPTTAPLP